MIMVYITYVRAGGGGVVILFVTCLVSDSVLYCRLMMMMIMSRVVARVRLSSSLK